MIAIESRLTISVVAQLDLVGLSGRRGGREPRRQSYVLQGQAGGPFHRVVPGGGEVEPDAVVGHGDDVETLRLRR